MSLASTPTLRHLASDTVPALPGATSTSSTRGDWAIFHAIAHAITLGVVVRGDERLRIVVDADRARGTELQRSEREDARAATEIEHGAPVEFAGSCQRVEPLQAQRRGRMRAGAEREARIQPHDGGIGRLRVVGQLAIPRHDPRARAEGQRHVLVHPRALPILVGDVAESRARPVERRIERIERGEQHQRIGVVREQRGQHEFAPQRRFTDTGFEDRTFVGRVAVGVEQGDREGADVFEGVFEARLLGLSAAQGDFEVRHRGGSVPAAP